MTNEELLVAMSNMMDQRLDEKLEPLKKDMSEVKDRVTNIELNIENDIRPGIITLCDAYGTQFDRYSISIESHEKMKTDIEVLKSIVSRHFDLLPEERRAIGQ
ncbi:hypothetical protein H8R94_05745 [Roseburia sp. NSJ-9]|uniref:Uncharacterized protein n=1 Tax=Roseburia lenta TaxID=2763061 RepID=A0ABR7GH81_9FIRM|nr:hypothetical protein [Roseburia lenta]MBC5686110.1 hypothetical protein [Roseburia lenta]